SHATRPDMRIAFRALLFALALGAPALGFASAPVVTTSTPTQVTGSTANLNGSVNTGGQDTTGWFRYSTTNPGVCNDSFGTRAPATGGLDLGTGSSVAYQVAATGLTQISTYYVCAIASNASGTSVGAVVAFNTLPSPSVTTAAATSVTSTTATLNGSAN